MYSKTSASDRSFLFCATCTQAKEGSEITKLKCGHIFCWTCLDKYMQDNLKSVIKCPQQSCDQTISDKIIRKTLSPKNIEKYERLWFTNLIEYHHCLLPQCSGVISYTDPNLQYDCSLCTLYNCVLCKAAHNFHNCEKYRRLSTQQKQRVCDEELSRAANVLKEKEREKRREIFQLENDMDILMSQRTFSCCICCRSVVKGNGVKLRECSHEICKDCLKQHILSSNDIPVECPVACGSIITDSELYSLLSGEELTSYQSKCNMIVKRSLSQYLQCKFPNCDSFYFYTKEPSSFTCAKCNSLNCVPCSAIHGQESCEDYQKNKESNPDYKFIEENIKQKKMMKCPECNHILCKKSGCNWIQCDKCFVELCWIRQMHRWGPKGRGDLTGGCGCMVMGKYCHPDCRGCIPDRR